MLLHEGALKTTMQVKEAKHKKPHIMIPFI